MKRVDITKSVMDGVTQYEKDRSIRWVVRFWIIVAILVSLILWVLWYAGWQLQERGTWDLLALIWEDTEIIQEFWQDTVMIFFEELPIGSLYIAGGVLLGLIWIIWKTRKKRQITKRRLHELAKRKAK
jgi:hypothetical protein